MKTIKNKTKFFHVVLISLWALLFFNTFNLSKYIVVFLSIYILFQLLNTTFLNMVLTNIQLWWLLLFCVLYVTLQINYQFMDIRTGLRYLLYPLVFYVFGIVIVTKLRNEKQIIYYLYATIIGLSAYGVSTVIYSSQIYGMVWSPYMRWATIPWQQDVKMGATGLGIYVALGISLSGLLFIKTNVFIKTLNALIFIFSLYSSISLANRTGLIIALLSVILIYFLQMRLNSIRSNLKIAFYFISQCMLLFLLFNWNVFNVKTFWLQSNVVKRFNDVTLSSNPRFITWSEAFRGVFSNPLGGKQSQLSLGYAHNLWLDVGWTTGLFPFILLVLFTLLTLKGYVQLLETDNISIYFKYLVTTMLCGFLLTFMVEPILEANMFFFCAFCFVSGIIRSINKRVIIRSF